MLEMIRRIDPRVVHGEQRLQKLQRLRRARLYETVAGELAGREVPGVELRELPHVERDPCLRLLTAHDLAIPDCVGACVLRDDVVGDLEDQRGFRGAAQVAQGTLHVYQTQHELRLYLGLDVGVPQVGVEGLATGGAVFDLEDQRVLGCEKGDQGPPRAYRAPDELLDREGTRRVALTPVGPPV